jgi:hypothetical protein
MKQRLLPVFVLALSLPALAEGTPLRVLCTVTFHDGSRTITVNRVAPHAVAAPLKPAEPPPLTAQELASIERRAGKDHRLLSLSATVLDREVTVLRWFAGGREYRAVSNLDFNLLRGRTEIETDDTL